jgi:hypothetical protein
MTHTRGFFVSVRNQRGVALPMALMVLVILGALIIAFSVLAASEPTIASNHLRVAQARALAEAGVERAIWALSKGKLEPGTTGSIAYPLPSPVPAPYNGSQLVTVATASSTMGGFRVTVSPAASGIPQERDIVAVGWVPTDSSSDTRTKAHQRITVTLMDFRMRPLDMPCALCVRGDVQVGGNSTISAREDTSCGNRYGTWSTRVLDSNGNVVSPGDTTMQSGASHIYGADGNNNPDEATDMAQQQSQATFDSNKLTNDELNALKALAKEQGTYYQGAVNFNSGNKIPDGLVFIDTVSGNNITPSTPDSDYAQVSVQTDAGLGSNNTFRGWLIVNGSLSIRGNIKILGMVYAVNDIQYTGIGTGEIVGQMISANVRDTIATVVDTSTAGNSSITYDCNNARTGGGALRRGFMIKPGSYKEVSDS